ncbi:MAG: threonine/serine dehydratase [Rhodospirillaceae bacterium]|nr:threonine/serine dehydratase [Rhodospirillaceae bacterium]
MSLHIDTSDAAARLAGQIVKTPLLACGELDRRCGGRVWLKAEPLQRTGSFKIRGALNRILNLTPAEKRNGVIAWSSGNHAQGIAAAAAMFDIHAVIVMPADAPALKIANTRALKAEVVLYDRATQDREQIARELAANRGLIVVPSYDDPYIIAGQGTVGVELMAQAAEQGAVIDDIIVPVSGGGLIAGVGVAARAVRKDVRLFAAEPQGYDDHVRSLAAGERVKNESTAVALCDALLAPMPGTLTWNINATQLAGGYGVSDEQVCAAMAFAFQHLKLVVEPGGAVALAAVLAGLHDCRGRTIGIVLSGGNVDPSVFSHCLAVGLGNSSRLEQ